MNFIKDKRYISLVAVLVLFTVVYFVLVINVSHAFAVDYNVNATYDAKIDVIKKSAMAYGENNLDLFKDNDTIYIKVQDLIDNNLLVADNDGNIVNPLKSDDLLNNKVIKIKFVVEVNG